MKTTTIILSSLALGVLSMPALADGRREHNGGHDNRGHYDARRGHYDAHRSVRPKTSVSFSFNSGYPAHYRPHYRPHYVRPVHYVHYRQPVVVVQQPQTIMLSQNGNGYCREYQSTVNIGGRLQRTYGTACQQPDGSWSLLAPL